MVGISTLRTLWWVLLTLVVGGLGASTLLWPDTVPVRLWRLGRRLAMFGAGLAVLSFGSSWLVSNVGGRQGVELAGEVLWPVLAPARTVSVALVVSGAVLLGVAWVTTLVLRRRAARV